MKPSNLITLVEFESQLASKLKRSFRSTPHDTPEKYYHLLMAPYLDNKYKPKINMQEVNKYGLSNHRRA